MGSGPPCGVEEGETVSPALSPSTGKRYGLARICRVWQVARATGYRQRQTPSPTRRPGPQGPCSDDELVGHMRMVLPAAAFQGEGDRKVGARLRYNGMRTSPRRVRRVRRAHNLLAPTRRGNPHGPKAHDGTIIPAHLETMWGTAMTTPCTRHDGQVAIFLAVEHFSAECVGIHAAKHGTRFEALEPLRQGVRAHLGAFGEDVAHGVVLRHDHGRQYMSQVCQDEIAFLGMESARRLCANRRAMGARNASCAPSKRTCCGSARSRRWKNSASPFWSAKTAIMQHGVLGDMATKRPRKSVKSNGRHSRNKPPEF
jgi:putative transposase